MTDIPNNAQKLEVQDSTVDFYKFIENGLTYYYFDTSLCGPPDPMVNAMVGLQLLKEENERLVMINHTPPNALFTRVDQNFEFDISQTDDGKIKVVFAFKAGSALQTDFSNNKCSG